MKKIFFFAIISFLVILASCVSTKEPSVTPETPGPDTPVQSEKYRPNVSAIHNVLPDGDVELLDGFEEGNFWQASSFDSELDSADASVDADITEEWVSEGVCALSMSYNALSSTEKASFFCEGLMDADWEGAKYFVADLNNTSKKTIAVYLMTRGKKSGEWSRTEEILLGVGQNTNVLFDLQNGITDENGTSLPELAEVSSIGRAVIVVLGKAPAATLMADNIRLIR